MLERILAPRRAPGEDPGPAIPVSLRIARWMAPHVRALLVEQLAPRIPMRVYVAGIAVGALLSLVIVYAAVPSLRWVGLVATAGAGGVAGHWRARSRRRLWTCVVGFGASWGLWCSTAVPVVGLMILALTAVIFAAIGIEHRRDFDPGALVREWGTLTAPGEPLAAVLAGSRLRFIGSRDGKLEYELTLRGGRTLAEALKIRDRLESAIDEVIEVRKGSLNVLADHERPAICHLEVEPYSVGDSPTEGAGEDAE